MARRPKYKFAKKVYAQKGILSTWIALASTGLFLISVIISYAFRGDAGVFLGGLGLMTILLSIFGFFLGVRGYAEKNCSHLFCMIGTLANGLISIIYLALYAAGVA